MDIKSFQNSFLFLQEYYTQRKAAEPEFSYEVWAQELGFKSRSYLRLVILGKRPINSVLQESFVRFFKFTAADCEYFAILIQYTQSKNSDQRIVFGKKLLSLASLDQNRLEVSQHYDFLTDAILPRLQTICGFADAPTQAEKLAEVMGLSLEVLQEKLKKLEELGLFQDQKPIQRSWKVEAASQAIGHREYYRETLRSAEKAMELPFEQRRFRSVYVAMAPEEFNRFVADFEIFVREQLRKGTEVTLNSRRLYQLNFNFFPASNIYQEDALAEQV